MDILKLKRHLSHCTPNEINEIKRFVEVISSERIKFSPSWWSEVKKRELVISQEQLESFELADIVEYFNNYKRFVHERVYH